MKTHFYGTVINNDDPKKIGRVKVKVNGVYDNIEDSIIPWALPKNIAFNRLEPPPIGSELQIEFIEGEIMCPMWYIFNGKSSSDMNIEDGDYITSSVLLYKDLLDYDGKGIVRVMFTETDGLTLEFEKDDNVSHIQLRKDNTVYFKNSQFDKVVHISNESISLGTEGKSSEPAVLGDKNNEALDNTNDTIKEMSGIIETYASLMNSICQSSSILRPLSVPNQKLQLELKSKISTINYERNKLHYPTTKSKIVSLD